MKVNVGTARQFQLGAQIPTGVRLYKWCGLPEITRFKKTYYLAFRTSMSHFAAKKTCIHILTSHNLDNWSLQFTIDFKSDIREPRFFVLHNQLHLAFFRLGANPFTFTPRAIYVMKKSNRGWEKPVGIGLPHQAMWRVRVFQNKVYMSTYTTHNVFGNKKIDNVFMYESNNAISWKQMYKGAGHLGKFGPLEASELEFIIDNKTIWGTLRGDVSGHTNFQSSLDDMSVWTKTQKQKYRYDDPTFFKHDKHLYLISRRSLDGSPDKARKYLPKVFRYSYNMARYSLTKKSLSLFQLDKKTLKFGHVLDFPSHGDTGYSSVVKTGDRTYMVVGYSNDIADRRRFRWISGQLRHTYLYQYPLTFST